MNLLREHDAPMSLNLALPPNCIPEFNGEYLDWPRFHDLFVESVHNKPYSASQTYIFYRVLFVVKRGTFCQTQPSHKVAMTTPGCV